MAEQPVLESTGLAVFQFGITARLAVLGALLLAEKVALTSLVDGRRARDADGLGASLHYAQHWGFRYLVTFLAAVSVLAFVRAQQTHGPRDVIRHSPEVRYRWILVHLVLMAALAPLSYFLFGSEVSTPALAAMAILWLLAGSLAVLAAAVGLIPVDLWLRGIRSLGLAWIYAAAVALLGTGAWLESEKLWNPMTAITFKMVTWALLPVLPLAYVDPATHVIATSRFAVEITDVCSGLEGLGLTLAFSVMWLAFFRREYIFPRALLLIPLSLIAIFALNILRIATLLLIGNAGYPEVASFGFHSQAGWIAFNTVACALAFFSRRSRWLNRTAPGAGSATEVHNPTAIYLVPLLAMLGAGTLSHALSGRFETFYPLRLIGGIAVVFAFRHGLLAMRWRWTWRGPAVGIGVFLLWVGAARWLLPTSTEPEALVDMMPLARSLWITSHCLTSVVFVPIAEELAYRGYLMRRLTHAEFEAVPYRTIRWPALTVTAAAFGAAHGALWSAGIAAGMAYGLLVTRRGSLGEAVAAHATTNALLVIAVVAGGQWQLW